MVPARERSTDFNDARFTIKAVIAIVVAVMTILLNQWRSEANVQTSINALSARMDTKEKVDANDAANAAKVEAEAEKRMLDWRSQVDEKLKQLERDYRTADYDLKAMIEKRR